MKKRILFLTGYFGVFIIFLLFSGCTPHAEHVNVYSGRHYQADEALFRQFTAETGIRVKLIKADTDQLINRMELEGSSSPADVLITADAGRLVIAKEKGLLQPSVLMRLKYGRAAWLTIWHEGPRATTVIRSRPALPGWEM